MTQYFIISSSKDKASLNIRDKLLSSKRWEFELLSDYWHHNPLYKLKSFKSSDKRGLSFLEKNEVYLGLTSERLVFLNDLKLENSIIDPNFLIFASRHSSKSGKPSFLVHSTGNWSGDLKFGGEKKKLSHASAIGIKSGFISLLEIAKEHQVKNFSIDVEVTHHGPTRLERPLMFMELGSKPSQWHHNEGGIVLADGIIESMIKMREFQNEGSQKVGLGFGGTHYAPQFRKLLLDSKNQIAISFICPKYYIKALNKQLIDKMIENTEENIDYFIIDWSGINSAGKDHLLPLLEDYNIPIKKIKTLRN
ncbi:MAG: hypothetical protein EU547_06970 [Promethearchaeota archaeon]|nr:MAG: hypothetical protein EU547_06970 [Candidatus Lokiarchaeota archaeon]